MTSSLSPLGGLRPRAHPQPTSTSHDRARVAPAPAAPASDTTSRLSARADMPRVEHRELTVDDARSLSIETVNLLVKENPGLVARLVIDAGRRRRAELPMSRSELRPAALAVILCGMKRRAEPLSAADESFLADYLESISAS